MQCEIRTYIGTRQTQEDTAGYCITEKGLFAVVCDGVGSRTEGKGSSEMAVQMFVEQFRNTEFESYPDYILSTASRIDRRIFDAYGDQSGTTAVTAYVTDRQLYWFSVGDSRLYILRGGKLRQITTDHNYSFVLNVRKDKHLIDDETYQRELIKGGQLVSFMGMGGLDLVNLNFQPFMLEAEDILFLTTDGLYKALTPEQIIAVTESAPSLKAAADRLIEAVKTCQPPLDNTTFAMIKLINEEIAV